MEGSDESDNESEEPVGPLKEARGLSKGVFDRQITMLANQGAMRNVELIQNMKDVYSIAWENKKSIRKLG